jgi:hypothetical protein
MSSPLTTRRRLTPIVDDPLTRSSTSVLRARTIAVPGYRNRSVRLGPRSALNVKRPEASVPITAIRSETAPRIRGCSHTSIAALATAFPPAMVR